MLNFNDAIINCEKENEYIYKFFGTLKLDNFQDTVHLDIDTLLLRGSSLKNTKWVYGVAVYTGHDSKVMMNSSKNKPKFSKIEVATNKFIKIGVLIQMVICLAAAIMNSVWETVLSSHGIDTFYLELTKTYNL